VVSTHLERAERQNAAMSFNNPENPNQNWDADAGGWAPGDQQQSTSQPSASYPASQPSAGYAEEHTGQVFPGSQPSAGYAPQPPAGQGGYGQQGAYGQQPGAYGQQPGDYPGQPPQGWGQPANDQDNFFKAIFDFGFPRYATPAVVKILYILGIVVGGLAWLGSGVFWLVMGGVMDTITYDGGGIFAVFGVLSWIFGLIPLFFYIIGLRVTLEFALATVRISQNAQAVRDKLAG